MKLDVLGSMVFLFFIATFVLCADLQAPNRELSHHRTYHQRFSPKSKLKVLEKNEDDEKDEDEIVEPETNGVLIGPLDSLQNNRNGNGPQNKHSKDLNGPDIAHARKLKRKKKIRPKRQTYNFAVNSDSRRPFKLLMNSADLERNLDYTGLESKEFNEEPTHSNIDNYLRNVFGQERETSLATEPMPERSDMWQPGTDYHRYDMRQQLYNGLPDLNYDRFVENEASDIDKRTTPRIGTLYNVESIEAHRGQPIGEPLFHGPFGKPDNFPAENTIDSIQNGMGGLRGRANTNSYLSPLIPSVSDFLQRNEREFNQRNPYLVSFNNMETTPRSRNGIYVPAAEQTFVQTQTRDKQIENFLNEYDQRTQQIANLYHNVQQQQQINDEARNQIRNIGSETEQLSDPTSMNNVNDISNDIGQQRNPHDIVHSSNVVNNLYSPSIAAPRYERRDILWRHNTIDDNNKLEPRNEVPNNSDGFMHSNVVKEFLKSFANQNQLPPEDSQGKNYQNFMQPNDNNSPLLTLVKPIAKGVSRSSTPINNPIANLVFNQNRQIKTSINPLNNKLIQGNPVLHPISSYSNMNVLLNEIQSLLPQANAYDGNSRTSLLTPQVSPLASIFSQQTMPTPQQAAIMTNMGTPETSSFNTMSNEQVRNTIANQQGIVMLMVTNPPESENEDDDADRNKEKVQHKELTKDGFKRSSSNVTDDDRDFSINLKKAADFVLNGAVKEGNISLHQRDEIERKLNRLLDKQYKNKTRGELRAITRNEIPRAFDSCEDAMIGCEEFRAGGVCPFMKTFMRGTCRKTCKDCDNHIEMITALSNKDNMESKNTTDGNDDSLVAKMIKEVTGSGRSTPTENIPKKLDLRKPKIPANPVMYLSFESASRDGVIEDNTENENNAVLEKGTVLSPRILGTCGKAVELNEGSISWSGDDFKHKPDSAISITMWVKVRKGGIINWFANGKKGDKTFFTRTKGAVVPPKVWTHAAGTFDSDTGLARIYINGDLEQEQLQNRGQKLAKNWLVNGIGSNFGDDSLHYVDEVVIYDRALTNSEVRMLYNRCMFNRMVLHFGFQKGNKTNINDQSGLENNGILIGGASQKENCDRCGSCLDLTNGPDPTMKIQQISLKKLPRIKLSLAVWVSLNSTKGIHNIFTTESSEGNIGYRLQIIDGRIRWAIGTDTVPVLFDNMTKNAVVPEALWTHVIATYNNENGVIKMYANSILKFRYVIPEKNREFLPTNWDNDASIGDRTLKGYLDEFIMYNWELDDSEALYVRNYCADHPKLVRFTVRVPLTKKTIIPSLSRTKKTVVPRARITKVDKTQKRSKKTLVPKVKLPIRNARNWWEVYEKLQNERLIRRKEVKRDLNKKYEQIHIDTSSAFTLLKRR